MPLTVKDVFETAGLRTTAGFPPLASYVPSEDATAYCSPFNLTGHPSVVLPLARSSAGLPIGLRVVGRRWDESRLLAIARHLVDVIGPCPTPPRFGR